MAEDTTRHPVLIVQGEGEKHHGDVLDIQGREDHLMGSQGSSMEEVALWA